MIDGTSGAEEWRPIPGLRGEYEASSHGRIRSMKPGRAHRILKPTPDHKGYLRFTQYLDGVRSSRLVHHVVLLAFVGPRPDDMTHGCHRDTDKRNNHVSNLRWDTPAGNYLDTLAAGKDYNLNKTRCQRGHEYSPENTYPDEGRASPVSNM